MKRPQHKSPSPQKNKLKKEQKMMNYKTNKLNFIHTRLIGGSINIFLLLYMACDVNGKPVNEGRTGSWVGMWKIKIKEIGYGRIITVFV